MYTPTLARFTSRDPLPMNAAVLLPGVSQYAYADNNPVNKADPSGRAPEASPPGDKPGTFNIQMSNCDPGTLEIHPGCCCTDINVRYKPTDAEKSLYRQICVKVWAWTRTEYWWPCSDYNHPWHWDLPKEKQSCWPPNAMWTDYPGGNLHEGIWGPGCPRGCAKSQIRQDFEGCAIGETASGAKVNLGCTWWGHQCDAEYSVATPLAPSTHCACMTDCKITRFPGQNLMDVVPGKQMPDSWDPLATPPDTYK